MACRRPGPENDANFFTSSSQIAVMWFKTAIESSVAPQPSGMFMFSPDDKSVFTRGGGCYIQLHNEIC